MARNSLVARSVAAVALMIGFYVLALGMIAGLLGLVYLQVFEARRIHLQLLFGCLVGAVIIAWAILPRPDRFPDPGPRLSPERQPKLFARLRELARATGQAMPSQVFLVPDMNAWVANRGGMMGIGSRRVMGLGLPLLQVLDEDEFSAVLVHEFGHYHGGDTKLGPWIYKTRSAIGRTLDNLSDDGILQLPFRAYASFFLSVTQAISRQQELTADRMAATIIGARSLVEGLKKVHALGPAYDAYWQGEALAVLNTGHHAPIASGFAQYIAAPAVGKGVDEVLEHALTSPGDRFDSHPPLGQRIAAVEDLVGPPADGGSARPAIELLGDVEACEAMLLDFIAKPGAKFEPISWDDVTGRVYLPAWRRSAERLAPVLGGATLDELPVLVRDRAEPIARELLGNQHDPIPRDHLVQFLGGQLGACITCALVDEGWELRAEMGEPVQVARGDTSVEPFALVPRLDREEEAVLEWNAVLQEHGLGSLPLATGATGEG